MTLESSENIPFPAHANVVYWRGYVFHILWEKLLNHLTYKCIYNTHVKELEQLILRLGKKHPDEYVRYFCERYDIHMDWFAEASRKLAKFFLDLNVTDFETEFQLGTFLLPNGYELRCGVPDQVFTYHNRHGVGVGILEIKTGFRPLPRDKAKVTRYLAGLWVELRRQGRAHLLSDLFWVSLTTCRRNPVTGQYKACKQPVFRLQRERFDLHHLDEALQKRYGISLAEMPKYLSSSC